MAKNNFEVNGVVVEEIYKIIKVERTAEETKMLLDKWYAMGYELVCSYMNGTHFVLKLRGNGK